MNLSEFIFKNVFVAADLVSTISRKNMVENWRTIFKCRPDAYTVKLQQVTDRMVSMLKKN